MTAVLAAALDYAKRGWPVFPTRRDKHPVTAHGNLDATTDEKTIRRWWSEFPGVNVMVACGDKLSVLDVDMHKDENGKGELKRLMAEHQQAFFITPVSHTGGGGLHILFQHHPALDIKSKRDVRPGVHFVPTFTAPPSVNDEGGIYQWNADRGLDTPLAPVPDWLIRLTKTQVPRAPFSAGSDLHITEGQRDIRLYHEGCALRGRGYPEEAIYEALLAVNRWCCDPPLPESVVRTKAHSAAQHPLGVARPAGKTLQSVEMPE